MKQFDVLRRTVVAVIVSLYTVALTTVSAWICRWSLLGWTLWMGCVIVDAVSGSTTAWTFDRRPAVASVWHRWWSLNLWLLALCQWCVRWLIG